jgi:hypothetical protein
MIRSLCVEVGRLLPQLVGELVPAQPAITTLAVQRREQRTAIENWQCYSLSTCIDGHAPTLIAIADVVRPELPVAHLPDEDVSVPPPSLQHMALSISEREQFLAEPHIAALSVSAGPDRGPLTVPIWYQYTPGGEMWVLTSPGSRKARLIEQAGRFTLMVERLEPTVRYVSVEGPATRTVPRTHELLLEMTRRYLPADKVQSYIEFAKSELSDEVAVYLQPQRWLSADLGAQ